MPGVHRIHLCKVPHVGEIDVDSCHIGQGFAGGCEQRAQVLQNLLGLRRDISRDQLAGFRAQCYLAAEEQQRACTHAGGERADWRCQLIAAEGVSWHRPSGYECRVGGDMMLT